MAVDLPTYGVFCVDPGGSTGLAWARLRDEGTIAERLTARSHDGSMTLAHPDWLHQAEEIARRWASFRANCHLAGLPAYYVCEDFLLTHMGSSDREGLYPVWVGAAAIGYRSGVAHMYEESGFGRSAPIEVVWQQPGEAKGYATDARMKRWGLWLPGKPHECDARRHLAYFIASKKSQQLRLARVRARTRSEAKL